MALSSGFLVTPWSESEATCDCCGRKTKTIWGELCGGNNTLAVYYVSWTRNAPDHNPNIDLIVGAWGQDSDASKRLLVCLCYKPAREGGSFMVVDSGPRLANKRDVCGKGLRRAEVVGTPLADQIFSFVDAIWLMDPRLAEVRALNEGA